MDKSFQNLTTSEIPSYHHHQKTSVIQEGAVLNHLYSWDGGGGLWSPLLSASSLSLSLSSSSLSSTGTISVTLAFLDAPVRSVSHCELVITQPNTFSVNDHSAEYQFNWKQPNQTRLMQFTHNSKSPSPVTLSSSCFEPFVFQRRVGGLWSPWLVQTQREISAAIFIFIDLQHTSI